MKILGLNISLKGAVVWLFSVVLVGAVGLPLITDTVRDWRNDCRRTKRIEAKKEILVKRQQEDIRFYEDSVRAVLDLKYAPELKRLKDKLQEYKGPGSSGIDSALRMKMNAVRGRKQAELNRLLEKRRREMEREIEDLELMKD